MQSQTPRKVFVASAPTSLWILSMILIGVSLWVNPYFYADSQTHFQIGDWYFPRRSLSLLATNLGLLVGCIYSWLRLKAERRESVSLLSLRGHQVAALILSLALFSQIYQAPPQLLHMKTAEATFENPLEEPAYHGDLKKVMQLVESGADINAHNRWGATALHFACGATPVINQIDHGSPEVVKYLVEHGAEVNAQLATGVTPLMECVANNNLESVQILIDHGADLQQKGPDGRTAFMQARDRGFSEIQALLQRAGNF